LKLLQGKIPDFTILVVGDGPERNVLNPNNYDFVRFLGHRDLKEIALASRVSLAILNPGRVGLVAIDSFALGVPLIATIHKYNAPEFFYLKDRIHCLLSQHDIASFAGAIQEFVNSRTLQEDLVKNCLRISRFFSIEEMVKNFQTGCDSFESTDKVFN
jgi:glycosyltransferase involved in cell wall biosynthesis